MRSWTHKELQSRDRNLTLKQQPTNSKKGAFTAEEKDNMI